MSSKCSGIDYLRSFRIFGLAIFDWTIQLVSGLIIGYYLLHLTKPIYWILWFILWTIIGIMVHVILKVPTMLGYYLGLNAKPFEKEC